MSRQKPQLKNVPTNIITGFLGVGKTTAILHLLQQKPENERWAVLVNEFGEVGIDGSLFAGLNQEAQSLFIREVPGGCMCCAAGLPLQIALTQLLQEARPDRLLIEPTGLGHPKEVIDVLSQGFNQELLDLQKTITLVDARKILEDRYKNHPTFIQQLEVADVIVANKIDQYEDRESDQLRMFLHQLGHKTSPIIYEVSMGGIKLEWLSGKASTSAHHSHHHSHNHDLTEYEALPLPDDDNFPDCGYLTVKNHGEGFHSQGWIFNSSFRFDSDKLNLFFLGIEIERLKGVFITDEGALSFNKTDGILKELPVQQLNVSRIEFIDSSEAHIEDIEQQLFGCLVT